MEQRFRVQITCPHCGELTTFEQPYPYHAGFGDQGFLYNEAGNLTLVWSVYDPTYIGVVGDIMPWDLTSRLQKRWERALKPAPTGGRWAFENPARCQHCSGRLREPIGPRSIYYFLYPGSIVTGTAPFEPTLLDWVAPAAS